MANKRKNSRSRNRKRVTSRKKVSVHVFPGFLAIVLTIATCSALGYLYVGGRCDALGKKIKQLEKTHVALKREIDNEEYKWSNKTSPSKMEELLAKHKLDMVWPDESTVVRIRRSQPPEQYAYNQSFAVVHD